MKCPDSGYSTLKVLDSKSSNENEVIFRSTQCEECNSKSISIDRIEALPVSLTKEKEEALIAKMITFKSDEKVLREIKTTLIEGNLRLVAYIAKKFENTGIQMGDLISTGTIGLIKSVNTFNPNKNVKLATYASRCIENEILMIIRRTNRLKMEVSIDEPVTVDKEGNELLLLDILGTEPDIISRNIDEEADKRLIKQILLKLTDREREIIELRFGLGKQSEERTQKEVADFLGVSQSYISKLEKKIMLRLKKEINKYELE